jgi:hypothetical protein
VKQATQEKSAEEKMLAQYGGYGIMFGGVLVVWFFYMGFLLKRVVREQQETNRLLKTLAGSKS